MPRRGQATLVRPASRVSLPRPPSLVPHPSPQIRWSRRLRLGLAPQAAQGGPRHLWGRGCRERPALPGGRCDPVAPVPRSSPALPATCHLCQSHMYAHTYTHTHTHTHNTCICIYLHAYLRMYTYINTYMCVCAHARTYIHDLRAGVGMGACQIQRHMSDTKTHVRYIDTCKHVRYIDTCKHVRYIDTCKHVRYIDTCQIHRYIHVCMCVCARACVYTSYIT